MRKLITLICLLSIGFIVGGCTLPSNTGSYSDYYYPDWTPDGKIICIKKISTWSETGVWPAGASTRNITSTKYFIVTMDEEGTQETTIRQIDQLGKVAMSPKGNYIAYSDGNLLKIITVIGSDIKNINLDSVIETFDWAPDETKLVYGVNISLDTDEVFVINKDGTNKIFLVYGRTPSWMPTNEANKIVFDSDINYKISFINLTSNTTSEINDSGFQFDWLQNGSQIVFADNGIWMINIDGTGKTKLLNDDYYFPKVSLDGLKLVVGDMNDSGIWTLNMDGTGFHKIK